MQMKSTYKMNQLFSFVTKAQSAFQGNIRLKMKISGTVPFRIFHCNKITFPCYKILLERKLEKRQHEIEHVPDYVRLYSKNNNKGTELQSIIISKLINKRKGRKTIQESIEDRQRTFQKSVENILDKRRISLTRTRRKIQERSKLIIDDIKETKNKVKEKIEEVIEKENIYTIPNLLCLARIGLSPLLGYLIVSQQFEYALEFMIVAGISDWTDGWIARNYKSQSSKLGSFLDPMADKVLIGTLFLCLTYVNLIPALTSLIIGRDIILIISGFVIRYQSLPPPQTLSRYFDVSYATAQLAPTFISKVNTGIQLFLAATTLGAPVFGYVNHNFLQGLWYVTATSTIAAAASYLLKKKTYTFMKNKRKSHNKKKSEK